MAVDGKQERQENPDPMRGLVAAVTTPQEGEQGRCVDIIHPKSEAQEGHRVAVILMYLGTLGTKYLHLVVGTPWHPVAPLTLVAPQPNEPCLTALCGRPA